MHTEPSGARCVDGDGGDNDGNDGDELVAAEFGAAAAAAAAAAEEEASNTNENDQQISASSDNINISTEVETDKSAAVERERILKRHQKLLFLRTGPPQRRAQQILVQLQPVADHSSSTVPNHILDLDAPRPGAYLGAAGRNYERISSSTRVLDGHGSTTINDAPNMDEEEKQEERGDDVLLEARIVEDPTLVYAEPLRMEEVSDEGDSDSDVNEEYGDLVGDIFQPREEAQTETDPSPNDTKVIKKKKKRTGDPNITINRKCLVVGVVAQSSIMFGGGLLVGSLLLPKCIEPIKCHMTSAPSFAPSPVPSELQESMAPSAAPFLGGLDFVWSYVMPCVCVLFLLIALCCQPQCAS